MKKFKAAIQLYTVRETLARDFVGTLRVLRDMGYKAVEWAFYYGGMEPDALAGLMRELGLETCGIYEGLPVITDSSGRTAAYARALGTKDLTSDCCSFVRTDWAAGVGKFIEAAKHVRSQGLRLLYHNHAEEFEQFGGKTALQILADSAGPELGLFEFDAGFAAQSGCDPASAIRQLGGRVAKIHLRDLDRESRKDFVEIGSGLLDIPGICAAAHEAGAAWAVVEQCRSRTSELDSARKSVDYLKRAGLVS
ncbi:MAG: TIM barrel protein [Lentisphaerae bacterium]|nr:TIM barrel protein [Lentisphaerota bacterium]